MKTSVFVGVSVDGFIAREDGSLDWLPDPGSLGEDHGYQAFFETVDAVVIGRKSYETVLAFDPWPYGDKKVVVLSSRPLALPAKLDKSVESMSCSPREVVDALSRRGFKHLYIDGGKTIQGFLSSGLIDRLVITRVPVLIGAGIPLFGLLPKDVKLRHVRTKPLPSGLVQSEYEVLTGSPGCSIGGH